MALITDYTSLKDAATEYMAREGDAVLRERIPTFIQFFEAKMNRMLFVTQMEQRSTADVDTGSAEPEFISLPSDFQTMRRVRLSSVTGKPRLSFMSQTQIEDYRYRTGNIVGRPVYFSIVGTEMELAPTPNEAYTIEMVYRKNIPPLATNTTNWLLAVAPDLYLYGTLMEAEPHMKNDARITTWALGFSTALADLNLLGAQQSFDSGPSTITLPGVVP